MKSEYVTTCLTPEQKRKINIIATSEGRSISQVVARLLEEALKMRKAKP